MLSRKLAIPKITHFVVGRDPAGVKVRGKDMYNPFAGQIGLRASDIEGVKLLDFKPVGLSKISN